MTYQLIYVIRPGSMVIKLATALLRTTMKL